MEYNRDYTIDGIKALGLIFMVLGHCGFPGTHFIYLFHMPIFFIASGYLFSENRVSTIKGMASYLKRKITSLWLPYVKWNVLFIVLNNVFVETHLYLNDCLTINEIVIGILKIICFKGGSLFASAFWFVRTLFFVEVLFAVFLFVCFQVSKLKNNQIIASITLAIVSLTIAYVLSIKEINLFDLAPVFIGIFLFILGYLIKKLNLIVFSCGKVCIVSFLVLLILSPKGRVLLNENQFTNPIYIFLTAISGWYLLHGICNVLINKKTIRLIFQTITKNSLAIMALHFLFFKMVILYQIKLWELPIEKLSVFPVLDGSNGWWIVYTFWGICGPLLTIEIKDILCSLIFKRRERYI